MNRSLYAALIILSMLFMLALAIWGLGEALIPLLISFGLAYLIFPVVKKLETRGIGRNHAVAGVFTIISFFVLMTSAMVIPNIIDDGKRFVKEFPQITARAAAKIESVALEYGYELDLSKDGVRDYVEEHVTQLRGGLVKSITASIKRAFSGVTKWLLAILNLFLIPLFFFYAINDYEKIANEIKSFIPINMRPRLFHYANLSNEILSGYIRGQLMVALVLGVLYATGLAIVGLRFGILIGIGSGLISIIPYAGFSLGFLTAIVVGLANYTGPGLIIGIVIVYLIVQALEGTLITPKLVGGKVGLSSFATLLALIIGGNLFGLIGMLAAIPVAAIIKSVLFDLKQEYQQLAFFKN